MTHPGLGARYEVAQGHGVTYSLTAEGHPPLDALAKTSLIPIFDTHLSANWDDAHRNTFAAQAGYFNFETLSRDLGIAQPDERRRVGAASVEQHDDVQSGTGLGV